jgi:hypothetical protein
VPKQLPKRLVNVGSAVGNPFIFQSPRGKREYTLR